MGISCCTAKRSNYPAGQTPNIEDVLNQSYRHKVPDIRALCESVPGEAGNQEPKQKTSPERNTEYLEMMKQMEFLGEQMRNIPSDSPSDTSVEPSPRHDAQTDSQVKQHKHLLTMDTAGAWRSMDLLNIGTAMSKELTKLVRRETKNKDASTSSLGVSFEDTTSPKATK